MGFRGRPRAHNRANGARWTPWAAFGGQWFDAATVPTGSPVSAWTARGGTATATQGTGANQPAAPAADSSLGGQLAIACDGTDRLISSTALDLSSAWTIVSVFSYAARKDEQGLFRLATTEASGGGGLCAYVTSLGHFAIASADTSWYRIAFNAFATPSSGGFVALLTCSGTSGSITFERGVISGSALTWNSPTISAITGTFAMPASSGLYLVPGGSWSSGTGFLSGKLGLVGATGRVITAGETTQLKAYLKARFAP